MLETVVPPWKVGAAFPPAPPVGKGTAGQQMAAKCRIVLGVYATNEIRSPSNGATLCPTLEPSYSCQTRFSENTRPSSRTRAPPYEITKHDESRRPLVPSVEVMFALVGFGEFIDRYELKVQIGVQKLHQIEYGSVGHYVGGEFLLQSSVLIPLGVWT